MRTSVLFASLVCVGLIAQPAAAADVYDGVTFEELQAALTVGLDVKVETTKGGNKLIFAQGKNHLIAAHTVHCGDDTRCDGARYFAVLDQPPSATAVNEFNYKFQYSKVSISSSGRGIISVEQHTSGGVTSDNLLQNALILMVRMTDLGGGGGSGAITTSLDKPGTTAALSAALAQEGFPNMRGNRPAVKLDPRVAQSLIEQFEAFGTTAK